MKIVITGIILYDTFRIISTAQTLSPFATQVHQVSSVVRYIKSSRSIADTKVATVRSQTWI